MSRMHKKVYYYSSLLDQSTMLYNKLYRSYYSRGSEQVVLSNQLGHACPKITIMVHFLYTKNQTLVYTFGVIFTHQLRCLTWKQHAS